MLEVDESEDKLKVLKRLYGCAAAALVLLLWKAVGICRHAFLPDTGSPRLLSRLLLA